MKRPVGHVMLFAGILLMAAVWIVHFHNPLVAGYLPKWGWVQGSLAKLGEAGPPPGEDEDPDNTRNVIPVHAGEVEAATLHRYVEGYGTVSPRPGVGGQASGATISAPMAGIVVAVPAGAGSHVKKGDVLVQLDDRSARSSEASAEAALAQAKASLAAVKATPRPGQLALANLTVEKARSALAFAQKASDRAARLAAGQALSDKAVQQAENDLAAARNDVAVAEGQLASLKSQPTAEDLAVEDAKVVQATAALTAARLGREMLAVTSPVDGVVVSISANPGELADPGKPLAHVVDLDRLSVNVTIPATELPAQDGGRNAEVLREGAAAVTALVAWVSPEIDARSGSIAVRIDLPPGHGLRLGQSVRVRIVAEERENRLVVPRAAVVEDENGDAVICVLDGDQATHKSVKTGLEEDGRVEVSADGLTAGTRVVTAGAYGLPQATKVKVVP